MKNSKRELSDQVVVITGASSGIGRQTALDFARKGARVVIAARSAESLSDVVHEIGTEGGRAHAVVTDVRRFEDIVRLADEAEEVFGRIDTWVNDAAIEEWALFEDHEVEEMEQLIRTNLLGAMYGTKVALTRLERHGGGTIINIGSVESKRPLPLQAVYAATKHGVKAFTQVLQMELEHQKSLVDLVLVMPGSINTPFFEHARTKIGSEPKPAPPVYEASVVSSAILKAAVHPQAEIAVGGGGKVLEMGERVMPRAEDKMMVTGGAMFKAQKSGKKRDHRDNLFATTGPYRVAGQYPGHKSSFYTRFVEQRPFLKRGLLLGALLGVAAVVASRKGETNVFDAFRPDAAR